MWSLMLTKAAFIWSQIQKKTEYCEIVKNKTGFYLNIFQNVIYSCDAKLNFQHHYSSLQSHDPSEIFLISWFANQETFLIIIYIENGAA